MNTKTPPPTLKVTACSRLLSDELGDTSERWTRRLMNWRKPERQIYAPFQPVGFGHPVYLESEIRAYIVKMRLEKGVIQADPLDKIPNATANVVRNQNARLLVQIGWNDANSTGILTLSHAAAEDLAKTLNAALADLTAQHATDFDQKMQQATDLLDFRTSDDGEILPLSDLLGDKP